MPRHSHARKLKEPKQHGEMTSALQKQKTQLRIWWGWCGWLAPFYLTLFIFPAQRSSLFSIKLLERLSRLLSASHMWGKTSNIGGKLPDLTSYCRTPELEINIDFHDTACSKSFWGMSGAVGMSRAARCSVAILGPNTKPATWKSSPRVFALHNVLMQCFFFFFFLFYCILSEALPLRGNLIAMGYGNNQTF